MGGKVVSLDRAKNDSWNHSHMQNSLGNVTEAAEGVAAILTASYSIYQESEYTRVASSSSVVQSFLSARLEKFDT